MGVEQQAIAVELDGTPPWQPALVDDVRAGLALVLAGFDRSGRPAFADLGRRSADGEPDGALLIRCVGRRVLVVGHGPMAEQIRQLLTATTVAGRCTSFPHIGPIWRRLARSWVIARADP